MHRHVWWFNMWKRLRSETFHNSSCTDRLYHLPHTHTHAAFRVQACLGCWWLWQSCAQQEQERINNTKNFLDGDILGSDSVRGGGVGIYETKVRHPIRMFWARSELEQGKQKSVPEVIIFFFFLVSSQIISRKLKYRCKAQIGEYEKKKEKGETPELNNSEVWGGRIQEKGTAGVNFIHIQCCYLSVEAEPSHKTEKSVSFIKALAQT